jgi:hypothetical protein
MLHASYELGGLILVFLLIGVWIVKRFVFEKKYGKTGGLNQAMPVALGQDHDIQHRALMFLMAQKTDSMLAALAGTIAQERQKLGAVVRKPSMNEALDAFQAETGGGSDDGRKNQAQIMPMIQNGITVSMIARRLDLPEAEVSLVMQMNAA